MALRKALHCAVDGEDDEGSKHHFPLGLHNENNREHAASGVNSSSLFIRWSAQLRQPFLCAPSSDNGTRLPHHSPNQTERGGHRSISYLSAYGCATRLILRPAFPVSDHQAAGYFLVDEQQIITHKADQDVFAPAIHCRNGLPHDACPEPGLRAGEYEILRPIGLNSDNTAADDLRSQIPYDDLNFWQFGHFPPG